MSDADVTIRLCGESVEVFGRGQLVYSVGLAGDEEVSDETLTLIFSIFEPDLAGEGYSLVVDPGQRCAYECVEKAAFGRGTLRLKLDPAAADDLGVPETLTLALELDDQQLRMLRNGLTRIGIHFANPS